MIVQVESRTGAHGDREPAAFLLGTKRIAVLQILDRWLSEESSYFKVDAEDGSTCILLYVRARQEWELTLYRSPQAGKL